MSQALHPYALQGSLPPDLERVLAYWKGLRRGGNEVPFWDDVNLSSLPDLSSRLMLLDVFETPQRFRFAIVGKDLTDANGRPEAGGFLDELTLSAPLEFLASQCSATVEARAPTCLASAASAKDGKGHVRLLLPLWGEGQVRMILGAVAAA